MSTPRLPVRIENHVARITFNNPEKHNAVSIDMWQGLVDALKAFATDPTVRVLVLSGAGDKAFVSGADISEFDKKRSALQDIEAYNTLVEEGSDRLADFPKPTIALIHGYCIGGGLGIAAGCDLRFASPGARFALPAARLGIGYRYTALKRLVDAVGRTAAADIFYSGRHLDADEALGIGFLNKIVPQEELESFVARYAERVAGNAPLSIASAKRAFVDFTREPSERDPAACRELERLCSTSRDYVEGRSAFRERRQAEFKGA